ncbi:MAG TPA: FHA domain-containing protein [Acidobacteriota bacterium]|nr:FHA domain-containing protein [Acidobacteriota bacterium]
MIVVCPTCQSKYKFDEAKLGDASSKKMRCPKCKGTIEVIKERRSVTEEAAAKSGSAAQSSALDQTAGSSSGKKPGGSNAGASTAKLRKDAVAAGLRARDAAASDDRKMPETKRFSLAVIAGANSGEIFHITRPVMVLGRADSDIVVNDIEASRQHAQIEVIGERVMLYDLNSTNGTYVNDQKIDSVTLESHSEFRIGSTVFMVIITDSE